MTQGHNTTKVYANPNGKGNPVELSESKTLGKGAEGTVYLAQNPDLPGEVFAIKIYSKAKSEEEAVAREEKINRMVKIGSKNKKKLILHRMIAWPQMSVYSGDGRFVGYAMKRGRGAQLRFLAHPMNMKKYFPDIDRVSVAKMLVDLWETVDVLHQNNIFIGDVNLSNILCNQKNYEPCLIDVDSFQVEDFPCPVGRPEMLPPEHLDKGDLKAVKRNRESDLFSLAILSFMCLMSGKHPYEHIDGGDFVENQKKGHCPYFTGGARPGYPGGVPSGPWHTIWSHYKYEIKTLFSRALKDGAEDPSARPLPVDWVRELKYFIRLLKRNPFLYDKTTGKAFLHSRDMRPLSPKPKKENLEKITEENRAEILTGDAEEIEDESTSNLGFADFIDNPTPRCAVALVLDTSAAMEGEKINELNSGVRQFMQAIRDDDFAAHSVEVGILQYGGDINDVLDFGPAREAKFEDLTAGGDTTPAGEAVDIAAHTLQKQVEYYNDRGISHYRPWLVLIAGGSPTDDCDAVGKKIQSKIASKELEVFVIYVGEGYDVSALKKFAPLKRPPALLSGVKFAEFFAWLSQSMAKVSESVPGTKVDAIETDSWRKK